MTAGVSFAASGALLLVLVAPLPVYAAPEAVPTAHKVKVLLTALSFDRALKVRAGETVNIAVLGSCETGDVMQEATGKAINGIPIDVAGVKGGGKLDQQLSTMKASVLFVCDVGDSANAVAQAAAKAQTLTLADDPAWVEKDMALSVRDNAGRAELILNNRAAKEQGAEFDPRIFGVAKVVE